MKESIERTTAQWMPMAAAGEGSPTPPPGANAADRNTVHAAPMA